MRLRRAELGLSSLLLSSFVSPYTLDCTHVRVGKQSFNFKSLGGPHSVQHRGEDTPSVLHNTTYTIDLCAGLRLVKDIDNEDQCPHNTRVCGIQYEYDLAEGTSKVAEVIPMAGEFVHYNLQLDPTTTRLKGSDSAADTDKEGVRIELNGGRYPFKDSRKGQKQKVFVEMLCDRNRTGLEGVSGDGRVPLDDGRRKLSARKYSEDDDNDEGEDPGNDDGGNSDEGDENEDPSLQYVSYKVQGEDKDAVGVLRLEWRTKWACEGMADQDDDDTDDGEEDKNKHWGFFTWFIIVSFLAVAAYLIFGSWLNYNRYGARGWDLLPHGDTIRDIPYIIKDWGRRVVSAIQGPGSRGGYSAV